MFAGSKAMPKTLPYKRRNQPAVDAAFQQANQAINQAQGFTAVPAQQAQGFTAVPVQQAQGFTAVSAQLPTIEPNIGHQLAVLTEAVQRLTSAQSKPQIDKVERLEEQLLELTERVAQLAEAHRRDRLRRARDRLDRALQY
jgi:hypothetical protein